MFRTSPNFKIATGHAFVIVLCSLLISVEVIAAEKPRFDFTKFFDNHPETNSEPNDTTIEPEKQKTQAGIKEVCRECTPMKETAEKLKPLDTLAKTTTKKKRAERIVPPIKEVVDESPNPDADAWAKFPDIMAYSQSNEIKAALQIAKKNARRASIGYCYRYVKNAIYNAAVKLTSHRLPANRVFPDRKKWRGDVGVGAIESFENEGFTNLITDPETKGMIRNPASAPKGSILIYKGGRNGGHIEIKTDFGTRGGYVSDFFSPDSILGNELRGRTSARYELVGVMVKKQKKVAGL